VSLIQHEAREVCDSGVQNCRRCGVPLCDLMQAGNIAHTAGGPVFQIPGATIFYSPRYVPEADRLDAVLCGWRVH
jgi:hypothetical protein